MQILQKKEGRVTIKIILIISSIFIYKLLSNIYYLHRTRKLLKLYEEWMMKKDYSEKILTYKIEILRLFEKANIKDSNIPVTQPTGYGQIINTYVSIQHNLFLKGPVFAHAVDMFLAASGVYRERIKECFSPKYWVDQILLLPKNLLNYLGLNADSIIIKIINIIYWFLIPLFLLWRDEFIAWIKSLIIR